MSEQLTQIKKQKFDPSSWQGYRAFNNYQFTGINLVKEVNDLDPDLVLDVGCGHNRFKHHIKNIIGFDQQPFPFADMHVSIEQAPFRQECADVALCLGSVQFGTKDQVLHQIERIVSWVKPGGYIVMRTFVEANRMQNLFFEWDQGLIDFVQEKHLLTMHKGPVIETDQVTNTHRRSWWWKKEGDLIRYQIDPNTCIRTERK